MRQHGGARMVLGILALPLTTLFSVGVGLGDTWLDWRGRKRGPTPPTKS
jgi:hypothetical protein